MLASKKYEIIQNLKDWMKENKKIPNTADLRKANKLSTYKTYCRYFGDFTKAVLIANCKSEQELKRLINTENIYFEDNSEMKEMLKNITLAEEMGDQAILYRRLKRIKDFIERSNFRKVNKAQWQSIEAIIEKYNRIFQKI
jgi:hypothetical protein